MAIVYFVVQATLTSRDRRRFGVDFMVSRGHRIVIFDIADIVLPNQPRRRAHYSGFTDLQIIVADTRDSFARAFAQAPKPDLVVFLAQSFGHSRQNSFALRAVSQRAVPYLIIQANIYPGYDAIWSRRAAYRKLCSAAARWREVSIANSVFARIPIGLLGIRPAAATVLGGQLSAMPNSLVGANTRSIWAHASDFDLYLEAREKTVSRRRVAVFLDQFLPFHPGFRELRAGKWIDPKHYFDCLARLFDRIEDELALEVEVAAHPRADYTDRPDAYRGRRVIYNDTAGAIGSAQLTISHQSAAIGLSMLFGTPVLPIAYRPHKGVSEHFSHVYEAFSHALGKPFAFIDEPEAIDLQDAVACNEELRRHYIENFIKQPGSPDCPLWAIVVECLGTMGIARL